MKVNELIEILQDMDPEAEVYVMAQRNWPFECSLTGVCQRSDFTEVEDDDGDEPEGDRWSADASRLPGNDVFLVQGDQRRYGDKAAWDVACRY